ncbi:MAG TPA: hypothetical protein VF988_01920, partial [Verrucomicrobiae bacterium]
MRQVFIFLGAFLLLWRADGADLQFDFGAPGSLTNFHAALLGGGSPIAWKILEDEVPSAFTPLTDRAQNLSRRSVLAQTSQDPTDERFPLFIYDGEKFRDFKFTTRFKLVSGINEQMAGVVFRFQNASNFYVVRVSGLGKNIRFYKVVNGMRSDPIGPTCALTPDWHQLAVQCSGNNITIWLDNNLVMPPLGDNTFTEGKIGFWTKSDAVSYFADASINYTPIIPAAQGLINTVLEQQPRIIGLQIYTLTNGVATILASKQFSEVGKPGTEAELSALQEGKVWFGREHGTVLVTLPFPDRNGDCMAAVRFQLQSFFGETQDNAVNRATMLLKLMESLCT